MTEKFDPRFAGYATRVAFDIRLTRPQIFYLSVCATLTATGAAKAGHGNRVWGLIHDAQKAHRRADLGPQAPDAWVPQMRLLEQRGLIEHGPSNFTLTPAGHHVMALLRIAGLAIDFTPAANEEKPRVRRKAGHG